MITLKVKHLNSNLTQELYDEYINSINVNNLRCTCGRHNTIRHAYYSRKVVNADSTIDLIVLRVKCKECGKTHAVIISIIIPYQSLQMEVQIRIIKDEEIESLMISNPDIDEQIIYRVKQRFKSKYKMWMSINNLSFESDLVSLAFKDFKSNYLQIRKVYYSLIQ